MMHLSFLERYNESATVSILGNERMVNTKLYQINACPYQFIFNIKVSILQRWVYMLYIAWSHLEVKCAF